MRQFLFTAFVAGGLLAGASLSARPALGQSMAPVGSGVQAFFGSQGTGYQNSSPAWGAFSNPSATGPYTIYSPISSLPIFPPATPTPVYTSGYTGANFQVLGGYTATFNDGNPLASVTAAKSIIADSYFVSPVNTYDAQVTIPSWTFHQANAAPQWAFEQMNVAADYMVTSPLGLFGGPSTSGFMVTGNVSALGGSPFVQFDARLEYTWSPFANTSGTLGPTVSLGAYSYDLTVSTSGPFGFFVPSVGSLAATPAGSGILEITGHLFVAGDPFDLSIVSVPEPGSLALVAIGVVAVRRRRAR